MDGKSLNITEDKLAQLKQLFPEVFAEDKVDFDKLKLILGEETLAKEERYELNWAGKYDAFKEIQKQTTATLIPDPENSIDFDTSENIFIEGENLEALRVLQKSYYGKIKMIYIDPPYNTGNDSFVYPDDYTERRSEYEERTGIKDEDGFLNKQDLWKKNTKENGQFHSVWLSMMYPRLFLARNLMREDGVIFVSIDDNEVSNLKLLMDMVFGEENFIASIVWERSFSPINLKKHFSESHDYIICYARDINQLRCNGLKRSKEANSRYTNPDNDYRGLWTSSDMTVGPVIASKVYEIITPSGKKIKPTNGRCWLFDKNKFQEMVKDNRIWFGKSGENVPRVKKFLSEVKQGITPMTLWKYTEVGHSQEAAQQLKKLFGGKDLFDYPKSVPLIQRMLELYTQDNDIILDFFGGSGTTPHAVLKLNQEDKGNRKFICVQMPEPTPENSEAKKAGYETISQISQARIKKVIEQIKAEQEGKLDFDKENPQDLGFKSFKLAPSNFKTWRSDAEGEALAEQLALFQSPYKEGTEQENMLYELLLKAGFPLTVPIQKEHVEGVALYIVDGGKMLLALEAINEKVLAYVLEVKPQRFVTLDKLFGKDDQLLTNTRLQLQEMGVDFQVI